MTPDPATAVVFFGHGSPIESANEAVREVARAAASRGGFRLWAAAFLEGGRPDLASAVAELAAAGATCVLVVPYFLTLGLHLQRDLPRLVADAARRHPGLRVVCGEPLDGHPAMAAVLAQPALETLDKNDAP